MQFLQIGRNEFRDKVYACWLGKNIGGTLGAPLEGLRHTHALTFYDPVPDGSAPNDDLDLQLVWLQMLEEVGLDPPLPKFAEYWSRYAASYPWNEYGFFMRNYTRGLRPPVAGCFENYYVDEMGSPIRSEIWACLHAGDPQAAAAMAWKDSAVDHAGGEGTCGEMFWAAVEAAAFVETDPLVLIHVGLNMIPLSSHVGRSIREAVWCWQSGLSFGRARERIATRFGHLHACNAVNLFIIANSFAKGLTRLADFLLVATVGNLVASIPVTPAGIGTRDAMMSMFFVALDTPAQTSGVVPVTLTMIIVCWGLIGAIVFMTWKVPGLDSRLKRDSLRADTDKRLS